MPQRIGAAADSTPQPQPALPATTPAALAAAVTPATRREARSSKKRKVWLSPGNDTPPSTPATPGGIPQVDGAESEPKTPDGGLAQPYRSPPTPPYMGPPTLTYRDPPLPPPMSQYFPSYPNRVICHLCFKNVHYLMYDQYDQCEFCHYRLKFAYTKL